MSPSREEIIKNVFDNMSAMKRGMYSQLHAHERGSLIPRSQLELLFAIKHLQPISFKQLAHQLYLTPGAISQLAEGLAQHGLVNREIDSNDRRIQCLSLSKKGEKLLQDTEKRRRATMEQVMQSLTTEELAAWMHVQQKLIQHFQSEADKHKKETK